MHATRLLASLMIWCALVTPQSFAQEESLIVEGSVTARFQYGDRLVNVHPMASNLKVPPELWQFRYLPLFLPEVDKEGKLVLDKQQADGGWGVSVRFWFDNTAARAAAFKAIKAGYPVEAVRIQGANVGCIPISDVKITVVHPKGKVTTDPYNPGADTSYTLTIPARTQQDADAIEAWLRSPQGVVKCEYKYGARNLKENVRTVTLDLLQNTSLQTKLDGLPKDNGMVYVHRDALRQLAEEIYAIRAWQRLWWMLSTTSPDNVMTCSRSSSCPVTFIGCSNRWNSGFVVCDLAASSARLGSGSSTASIGTRQRSATGPGESRELSGSMSPTTIGFVTQRNWNASFATSKGIR
jgi:hypothetical protein